MSTPKCLKATVGRAKGSRIPLKSSPVTIGRSDDNRISLTPDTGASRHHAELTEDDGVWSVPDAASTLAVR